MRNARASRHCTGCMTHRCIHIKTQARKSFSPMELKAMQPGSCRHAFWSFSPAALADRPSTSRNASSPPGLSNPAKETKHTAEWLPGASPKIGGGSASAVSKVGKQLTPFPTNLEGGCVCVCVCVCVCERETERERESK
jgi:hypothetical protein